jgi:hypothetical protein
VARRNAARRLLGGEPCAGESHARFGEGGLETEPPRPPRQPSTLLWSSAVAQVLSNVVAWLRLVWFGAGLSIGLGLGTLAVTPAPVNRASSVLTTSGAPPDRQIAAQTARSEAAATPVLSPPIFLFPTHTNLATVVPSADTESERPGGSDAPGATSPATRDEAPDETQPGVVDGAAESNGVEPPANLIADHPLAERGGPTPPVADPQEAGASEPAEAGVTMGTISNPVGFRGWALRAAPSTSARILASLPSRTRVQILPDRATGAGFTWVRVQTEGGLVGWVVANAVLR